jgi:hypothetical protein
VDKERNTAIKELEDAFNAFDEADKEHIDLAILMLNTAIERLNVLTREKRRNNERI